MSEGVGRMAESDGTEQADRETLMAALGAMPADCWDDHDYIADLVLAEGFRRVTITAPRKHGHPTIPSVKPPIECDHDYSPCPFCDPLISPAEHDARCSLLDVDEMPSERRCTCRDLTTAYCPRCKVVVSKDHDHLKPAYPPAKPAPTEAVPGAEEVGR